MISHSLLSTIAAQLSNASLESRGRLVVMVVVIVMVVGDVDDIVPFALLATLLAHVLAALLATS